MEPHEKICLTQTHRLLWIQALAATPNSLNGGSNEGSNV